MSAPQSSGTRNPGDVSPPSVITTAHSGDADLERAALAARVARARRELEAAEVALHKAEHHEHGVLPRRTDDGGDDNNGPAVHIPISWAGSGEGLPPTTPAAIPPLPSPRDDRDEGTPLPTPFFPQDARGGARGGDDVETLLGAVSDCDDDDDEDVGSTDDDEDDEEEDEPFVLPWGGGSAASAGAGARGGGGPVVRADNGEAVTESDAQDLETSRLALEVVSLTSPAGDKAAHHHHHHHHFNDDEPSPPAKGGNGGSYFDVLFCFE